MKKLAFALALTLLACTRADVARELSDPCSAVSWATVAAGCIERIKSECVAGDDSCPVYVECSRARQTWQDCK